jgi:Holliday junction resolvase RusA-like endonuclease
MNKTNHPGYARECPLHVLVTFYLAKPPSVRREHPTARPDLDKLVRATLDGLTQSGAIVDDAQVVAITTRKQYAEAGAPSGARLMVMESNPV